MSKKKFLELHLKHKMLKVIQSPCLLWKLAIFLYAPLLLLQHVHAICNAKIGTTCLFYLAWSWKTRSLTCGLAMLCLPEIWTCAQLTWVEVQPMTPEVTILNHRAPIRLYPRCQRRVQKYGMACCGDVLQSIINQDHLQTLISGYISLSWEVMHVLFMNR